MGTRNYVWLWQCQHSSCAGWRAARSAGVPRARKEIKSKTLSLRPNRPKSCLISNLLSSIFWKPSRSSERWGAEHRTPGSAAKAAVGACMIGPTRRPDDTSAIRRLLQGPREGSGGREPREPETMFGYGSVSTRLAQDGGPREAPACRAETHSSQDTTTRR